ncbi:MAG: hypothetical protein B7C24_06845 [Bacteroidetes bacterium 4572_77]|nr:MAG: hypothetical protein B7C24_06845 [Bacteroidetes bacterium 4572_77]
MKTFKESWAGKESRYNHWTSGKPTNQIQFAFRKNYEVFKWIINIAVGYKNLKVLEVGCGRGTISNYFLEDGHECHMLDFDKSIVKVGRQNLKTNTFVCGDALNLPYKDSYFDVVVSVGLLEHFEKSDIKRIMNEAIRVLRPGGLYLHYVVPKTCVVQERYGWINNCLRRLWGKRKKESEVFVNDLSPADYKEISPGILLMCGLYPLPMISYSPKFPFTLMPPWFEKTLVAIFKLWIFLRGGYWSCDTNYGQAFLLNGRVLWSRKI